MSESCKSSRFLNRLRNGTNQSIVVKQSRTCNLRTARPKTPKWTASSSSNNEIRWRSSVWRFVKKEIWGGLVRSRFTLKRGPSVMKVTCRDGPSAPGRTFSHHFRKLRFKNRILRKRYIRLRWCHTDETIEQAHKSETRPAAISSTILSTSSWGSSTGMSELSDGV